LLAELYKNGIMNERTRIGKDYCLDGSIFISQDDINQLIIAKAGLRTYQDLLVKYSGINIHGIDKHLSGRCFWQSHECW